MSRVAMCRACKEPLVCTLAFSKKEFVCVKCGRLYDWLEPAEADETPELLARIEELKVEWKPIGSALLSGGIMLKSCETCSTACEPHLAHATEAEKAAHEEALAKFDAIRSAAA